MRYVGLTRDVARRLSRYCRPHTKHLANWFQSIINRGSFPVLEVIESVEESLSGDAERRWIKQFRDAGGDLLNYTDGGERGYAITEEYRRHLSESQRGLKRPPLSEAHKQAISRANKGILRNPNAPEQFRRIYEAQRGVPLTEEQRKKVSDGVRRSMTPEVRKRMSDSHKGKRPYVMTDEIRLHMSESAKRRARTTLKTS